MIVFAARIVADRVKEPDVAYLVPTFLSMLAGYFLIAVLVTGVIVQPDPWWKPQYFLPLGGMIIGNSMNALAISLERLFSTLRSKRDEVEMRLSLGADYEEASREILAQALKAGMIPSINNMMGVGVVFIPGLMTGQILAGARPYDRGALSTRGHADAGRFHGPFRPGGPALGPGNAVSGPDRPWCSNPSRGGRNNRRTL